LRLQRSKKPEYRYARTGVAIIEIAIPWIDSIIFPMFRNISIIGDGGMATVLAILLCEKSEALSDKRESGRGPKAASHEIRMWGYDREQLKQIQSAGENKRFLPGYKLPENLAFDSEDGRIMASADLIISAVPCQFMRRVWDRLKDYIPDSVPVVSVAKGIENDTLMRPTQILADVLGLKLKTAVLSGPTIADELARRLPATACAASSDEQLAKELQYTFNCPWLRVYTNTDIVGVELAAACKNIIAIAAGIIDGMGAGDNAKAALLCRGLAEITRLGVSMGARPQTFAGLTGLGDLVTTCISPKGRNRSFGERIGKGQNIKEAKSTTESVIEGIDTCKSVIELAGRYNIEMPITQAVYEVLFEDKAIGKAIADLMKRQLKAE
jgi:glycerol-3-phosphate dehydrogenase (NAD(P)+)